MKRGPQVTLCEIVFWGGEAYFVVGDSKVVGSRRIMAKVDIRSVVGSFANSVYPAFSYANYKTGAYDGTRPRDFIVYANLATEEEALIIKSGRKIKI